MPIADYMIEGVIDRCSRELARIDSRKDSVPTSGRDFRRLCKDIAALYDEGYGAALESAIHRAHTVRHG